MILKFKTRNEEQALKVAKLTDALLKRWELLGTAHVSKNWNLILFMYPKKSNILYGSFLRKTCGLRKIHRTKIFLHKPSENDRKRAIIQFLEFKSPKSSRKLARN